MLEYIKKSSNLAQQNNRYIHGTIPVYVKDHLLTDIDLNAVLSEVQEMIPKEFMSNIDIVYIGNFKAFHKDNKNFNAMYQDNALYISNEQDNEVDMLDDIIHEIAHAVEEQYREDIYFDNAVQKEFLGKRERLYHLLKQEGLSPSYEYFLEVEYNRDFDDYLYKQVGYPTLTSLTIGLFYSPYAITSLREYFANGFENYFLRDANTLRQVSPSLYRKIENLIENVKLGEKYEI